MQHIANAKHWPGVFSTLGLRRTVETETKCSVFDDTGEQMCVATSCKFFSLCPAHRWRLIHPTTISRPVWHNVVTCDHAMPHFVDGLVPLGTNAFWQSAAFIATREQNRASPIVVEDEDEPPPSKRVCIRSTMTSEHLLVLFNTLLQTHPQQFHLVYRVKMQERARCVHWVRLNVPHDDTFCEQRGQCTITEENNGADLRIRLTDKTHNPAEYSSKTFRSKAGAPDTRYIRALMFLTGMSWPKQKTAHLVRFSQDIVSLCNVAPEFNQCESLVCASLADVKVDHLSRWYRDIKRAFVCTQCVLTQIPKRAIAVGRYDADAMYVVEEGIVNLVDMKTIIERMTRAKELDRSLLMPLFDGQHYAALNMKAGGDRLTLWSTESKPCDWHLWEERKRMIRMYFPAIYIDHRPMWTGVYRGEPTSWTAKTFGPGFHVRSWSTALGSCGVCFVCPRRARRAENSQSSRTCCDTCDRSCEVCDGTLMMRHGFCRTSIVRSIGYSWRSPRPLTRTWMRFSSARKPPPLHDRMRRC